MNLRKKNLYKLHFQYNLKFASRNSKTKGNSRNCNNLCITFYKRDTALRGNECPLYMILLLEKPFGMKKVTNKREMRSAFYESIYFPKEEEE